jgi:glutamine synthetase
VTLGEAVAAFRDGGFAADALGKDVVAHYAEAGRWEWERFLAPEAVAEWERRRYFEVI